jgi:alanine dehydrogenase
MPWLFLGLLVWPITSGGASLYALRQHLSYAASFGDLERDAAEIRRLAAGRQVALGYYPGQPMIYFLADMPPIAGYLYLWPWVAEVGIDDVIAATRVEPAIVFLDCGAVRAGNPVQRYLAPLEVHLQAGFANPAPCVYVSPSLASAPRGARLFPGERRRDMALLIKENDVREVLTMDMALEAVELAFKGLADGSAINLPRRRIATEKGVLHLMASTVRSVGALGLKAYPTFGGPTNFLVPLWDSETGKLLALIEADWLGRLRTGAASGIGTKYMAREDSRTLGLFGTGSQARTQLLAVCAVRPIERVYVYSRSPEKRAAFVAEMQPQVRAELLPVDQPQQAVEGLDIVTTMTTASQPVFNGDWLAPGAHINAAGANHIRRREIDARTVRRAGRVAADSVEQARLECGDLAGAVEEGAIGWEDVIEFAGIVAGTIPGRASQDEITLFESQGISVWDVAAAAKVYGLARERGLGVEVPLFEAT